jgi:hypothetical protein
MTAGALVRPRKKMNYRPFLCFLALTALSPATGAEPSPENPGLAAAFAELQPLAVAATTDSEAAPAIPWVAEPFELDGRLAEPFWKNALIWELAYERQVELNAKARQRTLFLAALAGEELRLAFLCLDDAPHRLRAQLSDRLAKAPEGDYVWVGLGPLGDDRSIFFVYVNPRNVQADSLYEDGGKEDHSFDFPWQSAARIADEGWTAEIRVPLRTLRHAAGAAFWRLGAARRQTSDFSHLFWPVRHDPDRNCLICQYPAARVELPAGGKPALQAIPFLLGLAEKKAAGGDGEEIRGGLDLKWQPRPNLVIDATIEPDFSQVEVDDLQLTSNLRFAPFVPERRPFFLERADLLATPLRAVHTRSILEPSAGLRFTGSFGSRGLAALAVRDDATLLTFPGAFGARSTILDTPSTNILASFRQTIGSGKLGLLAADRSFEGGYSRLVSLDGKLPLGGEWNFELQALASRARYPAAVAEDFGQPREDFDGYGGWAKLSHYGRKWTHRWELEALGDGLRADLGFLPQVGYERLTVTEWHHHFFERPKIRDAGVFLEAFYTRHDGETRDWEVWVGSDATLWGETYFDLGAIVGEDSVSTGLIDYRRVRFIFRSKPAKFFGISGSATRGTGIDYELEVPADYLTWETTPIFRFFDRVELSATLRRVALSDGGLLQDQQVRSFRLEIQPTPRFGLVQLGQWSRKRFPDPRFRALGRPEDEERLELQGLLRYRLDYGTAAFLGFYRREEKSPLEEVDRGIFFKLSYLFGF